MAGRALPRRPACSLARVAHGGSELAGALPWRVDIGDKGGGRASRGTGGGGADGRLLTLSSQRQSVRSPRRAEQGKPAAAGRGARGGTRRLRAEHGPVAALRAGAGDVQSRVRGGTQSRGRQRMEQGPAALQLGKEK
jgi:hypothetical protein